MEIVYEIYESEKSTEEKYHEIEKYLIAIQLQREIIHILMMETSEENENLKNWYSKRMFETGYEKFFKNYSERELFNLLKDVVYKVSCVISREYQEKDEIIVNLKAQ